MSGLFRQSSLVLAAWAIAALLTGCPVDPGVDADNPAGIVLERAAGAFTPGQEFTVTVSIDAEDGSAVTALGLTEFAPADWRFVRVEGHPGQVPAVPPQEGTSGELGFLWIAVPNFPVTFSYTLLPPLDAARSAAFTGRVYYYEDRGILSSESVSSSFVISTDVVAENPAGVVLEREVGDAVPDEEMTVTIKVDAAASESITAIALTELVPDGWRFVNAASATGQAPAIRPSVNATGALDFLWLTVPEFPLTFTYTLLVPSDAAEPVEISGRIDYFQDAGRLSSEDTRSTITPSP